MIRHPLVALLLCVWGVSEAATPIYRCGPGGKEYSQRPCADGKVMDGTDGRTGAQRAAAQRVAEQERKRAAEMERERIAEERRQKASAAAAVGIDGLARPADKAASAAEPTSSKNKSDKVKSKAKVPKDFVAVEPTVKKK
jgi:hypothetical protein